MMTLQEQLESLMLQQENLALKHRLVTDDLERVRKKLMEENEKAKQVAKEEAEAKAAEEDAKRLLTEGSPDVE